VESYVLVGESYVLVGRVWSRHGTSGIHGHLNSWLYRMDLDAGIKSTSKCHTCDSNCNSATPRRAISLPLVLRIPPIPSIIITLDTYTYLSPLAVSINNSFTMDIDKPLDEVCPSLQPPLGTRRESLPFPPFSGNSANQ
jgi:hypothetical protein